MPARGAGGGGSRSRRSLDRPFAGEAAPAVVLHYSPTVLLTEQSITFARAVADRALVIEQGRIRYAATMAALLVDAEVLSQTSVSKAPYGGAAR